MILLCNPEWVLVPIRVGYRWLWWLRTGTSKRESRVNNGRRSVIMGCKLEGGSVENVEDGKKYTQGKVTEGRR